MFRRPRFRPPAHDPRRPMPPALKQAHFLMSQGRFEEAAELFERLAKGAEQRHLPHDARLFLTAGHCRLQAGMIEQAMQNFQGGLLILSQRANEAALKRAGLRVTRELTEKGFTAQADALREEFLADFSLPQTAADAPSQDAEHPPRGTLPPACPSCGGTLRSDEVDWIDHETAECCWCGASVISRR